MWTSTFNHPLKVGTILHGEVPPCQTCAKIRNKIPGLPKMLPVIFEGAVDNMFTKGDKIWYKLSSGALVEAKYVTKVQE